MSISAIVVMVLSFALVIFLTAYSLYKTITLDIADRRKEIEIQAKNSD